MKEMRIIYDLCSATRDRRMTSAEDIKGDINVEDLKINPQEYTDLLELIGFYDEDEFEEYVLEDAEGMSFEDKFEALIDYIANHYLENNDPGDGSPNILYLSVDGKVIVNAPYESMEDLDLEHISEKDLIDAILQAEGLVDD